MIKKLNTQTSPRTERNGFPESKSPLPKRAQHKSRGQVTKEDHQLASMTELTHPESRKGFAHKCRAAAGPRLQLTKMLQHAEGKSFLTRASTCSQHWPSGGAERANQFRGSMGLRKTVESPNKSYREVPGGGFPKKSQDDSLLRVLTALGGEKAPERRSPLETMGERLTLGFFLSTLRDLQIILLESLEL